MPGFSRSKLIFISWVNVLVKPTYQSPLRLIQPKLVMQRLHGQLHIFAVHQH